MHNRAIDDWHCARELSPTSWQRNAMVTEELYRQRAKEARQKAAATSDDLSRLVWLEIVKGFERLADVPGKTPWHVERVERKEVAPSSGC